MPVKPLIEELPSNLCPFETVEISLKYSDTLYHYEWYRNGVPIADNDYPILSGMLIEAEYKVAASLNGQCEVISDPVSLEFGSDIEKPELVVFGPNVWYIGCTNNTESSYRWFYNGNLIEDETGHICMANQNLGEYYLEISDEIGCTAVSDIMIIPTDNYTKGAGQTLQSELKIYPNPSDGEFTLELINQFIGEIQIEFIDLKGRSTKIDTYYKTQNQFTQHISTQELSNSIYHVKIKLGTTEITKILILNK